MRIYKEFISPEINRPDPVIPPKIVDARDAASNVAKRRQRANAVFASDEELKLGIAGKLGV